MHHLLAILTFISVQFSPAEIINDIFTFLSETEDVNYDDLYEQLMDLHANPIDLNHATEEDLEQLRFLNDNQIDNILLYIYKHPMDSLSELRLIEGLADYEIRDMLPFVCLKHAPPSNKMYAKEVFHYAKHELHSRTDARYIELPKRDKQLDPIYTQFRYKFNYQNRVQMGATLRRPTGSDKYSLQYGGYVQVSKIGPLQDSVLGNFQAQYGLGLVIANPFHPGKTNYVMNVGSQTEGLRKYSSVDGNGLHGLGTSWRYKWLDAAVWYSITKPNDSIHKHHIGANLSAHYKQFKIGITATENIYSDSLRYYYENAKYNQNYFRGDKQFVGGINFRWNQGIVDLFGELATAQNRKKWGVGTMVGMRVYPMPNLGLIALYRYYSPHFDNILGYAFTETSRINDENGGYLGVDIKLIKNLRIAIYGDLFHFQHIKYGIPYSPSWGYDTQADIHYIPSQTWDMNLKFRAKQKAKKDQFVIRYRFQYRLQGWQLNSQLDANLVRDSLHTLSYGASVFQDIGYTFPSTPITLQMRLQGFYVPEWDNRIYIYENDVLYGYSIPSTYGLGGKIYANFRWQIIPQLALYLKVSETIYANEWMRKKYIDKPTRTDIHLFLRAVL